MLTMGEVLMCLVKPKIALVAAQKKLAESLTSLVAKKFQSPLKSVVAAGYWHQYVELLGQVRATYTGDHGKVLLGCAYKRLLGT